MLNVHSLLMYEAKLLPEGRGSLFTFKNSTDVSMGWPGNIQQETMLEVVGRVCWMVGRLIGLSSGRSGVGGCSFFAIFERGHTYMDT